MIVSILDAFHFDLSGSQLNVKLVPRVTTEEGNQEQGKVNPYLTNRFSHHYHLGSPLSFLGVGCSNLFHFLMKFLYANRIAPDGTSHSAASQLGLYCLPMSHKRDARLK